MSSSLHSPSAPEETMDEQRLFLRKKVPLPVPIELLPGKEMWLHDIGEGGLSVSGSSRLEPGTATFFSFQFPDSNSIIEATGVVAWCDGAGRVGIRFTRIKPDSSAVLKRWLKSDETHAASTSPAAGGSPPVQPPRAHGQITELRTSVQALSHDPQKALGVVVEHMLRLTRASGAAIAWRQGDGVGCQASIGTAPGVGALLNLETSATGESYRTGNIVSVTDTETDVRVDAELCRKLDFRSLLIVPIAIAEDVVGIAEVFSPLPGNFEGGDILFLGSIAELVAAVYGWQHRVPSIAIPVSDRLESDATLSSQEDGNLAKPAQAGAWEPPKFQCGTLSPSTFEEEEDSADVGWKPHTYLLLMVLLSILGAGVGDLLDWHLTSKLMKSRHRAAPQSQMTAVPETKPVPAPAETVAVTSQPNIEVPKSFTANPSSKAFQPRARIQPHPTLQANLTANLTKSSLIDTRIDVPEAAPASPPVAASGTLVSLPASTYTPVFGTVSSAHAAHDVATQLTPAKLLHRVEPVFPDFARSAGMQGTILLSAIIGTDGRLKDVKLVSGNRALATEAFRALREWRYRPYLMNGHPIEAETRIVMDFHP